MRVEVEIDGWPNMVQRLARAVVAELGDDAAEQIGLTAAELAGFVGYTCPVRLQGGSVAVEIDTWARMLARMTLAVVDAAPRWELASVVLGLPAAELRQRARLARRLLR